ncbi:MAG TPA: cation:dicarboxylase symporter family transporter [Bacteroidales bacterium]|nr:cation:dicarboxylase symporter family transporter [Bacteroidales bacterium]HPT03164.1 cation:dicarboxylase symporter family transporter [Bacteroidales bacterium]
MKISARSFLFIAFSAITAVILFNIGAFYDIWPAGNMLLAASRWSGIAVLVWYAFRRRSLTSWILVSMVAGAEFGYDLPAIAVHLNICSKIFLRMVKTIIAPLLFATLVVGIAGHSNLRQVGRMGWKSIVYFEAVSTIALFIGLFAINWSKAGTGVVIPPEIAQQTVPEVKAHSFEDIVLQVFPENIAKAIYEGQVLQIVIFSIIFGIAVAMLREDHRRRMVNFAESLSEAMFKFTNLVMYLAPVAVFAAIAYSVGHMGLGILGNLFKLLATLYVALFLFLLGVLLPVALILKIPVKNFVRAISEPATIAFATTSSESALPIAMEAMEKFGVPRKIVAFVIPTGYSFNLDGTTLYLSLATVFVAQVAGIHLSFDQQLLIVFTLMLTSKGVAGVPRASLVILLGTAASFGLPAWPIFIILGIDELMDMARTAVNVIGNCLATAVVARWEKEFDEDAAKQFTTRIIEK